MHKILISVFDTEEAAYQGLSALKDLHRDGDITLYASAVIAKDADGKPSVRQTADRGPIGTLAGVVAGGLVGLLGGPAGVAMGAYVGGVGGLMVDLFDAGIGDDLVAEVSATLTAGKAAVVADVDESWVTPVETRLEPLGATTFRRLPGDVIDEELAREAEAMSAELQELRDELRTVTGEAKRKVEAAIERQRRRLAALVERAEAAVKQEQADFEARLATLNAQRQSASERQRARIDARIDELKASHAARRAKLHEARDLAARSMDLTREALVP
jgi:uncharacterized membrane protein